MDSFMKYIGVIKYILLVFLLVFVIGLLSDGNISKAKFEDVTKAVTKALDMKELSEADHRMVKRFYGLNANDYEGVSLYVSDSNMAVEEVLIVKLKDTAQSEQVESAIKDRLDSQLESFEGYGAEQCKLLNDHVLDVEGNYILYVVNKKAKGADKAFQKSL
mgnify:CR=1 FL=1